MEPYRVLDRLTGGESGIYFRLRNASQEKKESGKRVDFHRESLNISIVR
jgi:hypothetical protein